MIKEAIGFGNSIDEAKENAIADLNASDFDDIQFEVIAMPKKKVLGMFGGAKAQVRAFVELPDKKVKKQPAKKAEKKASAPKKTEEKSASTVKEVKKESEYGESVDESMIDANSPAGKAIAYIRTVLVSMGCNDITVKVASKENASLINLNGEDISVIIGRRGETLDALQYLASLAANNGGGRYRISLNIGNYRERREQTLTNLAKRISAQVLKTGKSRTLEPMNPYERRIIHTAVQNIEGVVSNSFGDGAGRRVVISVEGAQVKPPRMNDRRRGGRPNSHRPSQKVTVNQDVAREPKKDSDTPLYGKIN